MPKLKLSDFGINDVLDGLALIACIGILVLLAVAFAH